MDESTAHSDDCLIATTGICTCTQTLGQPAAQINRKRLVEEFQKGHEVGFALGSKIGHLEGKQEGLALGRVQGREDAIAEWTAAMNRANGIYGTPDGEMPEFIKSASPLTQKAWKQLHKQGPAHAAPAAPSTWDEIIHGREDGKTVEDITQAIGIVNQPKTHNPHISRLGWFTIACIALGVALLTAGTTYFFGISYPFLWSIGTFTITFCSIAIKLDVDARKRL